MAAMQPLIRIATFYCFTPIDAPEGLKAPMLARMQAQGVRGTITLAREGINATISAEPASLEAFMAELHGMLAFTTPTYRLSETLGQPFKRAKVKVKPELISLGEAAHPAQCVGRYVKPVDWNALITAPDVITVDTRNDYEYALGHFTGAVNPGTRHFKDMVAWTAANLRPDDKRRIAMYCTGGIRCEKYSAYLVAHGFGEVYHLHGGILAYLEQVAPEESLWQGQCFVFDERVAVGQGLQAAG